MTLKFLGTGTSTGVPILTCQCSVCTSSDPHDKRTRPSILLEYDGRVVVIDTTPDFRTQALREGLTRLDAVVFTHHHADHILGLDDTRVFYFRQQVPIPIYAEARCMATIRATFSYIFEGNYPFGGVGKLDPHLIEGPFDLWGLTLTPVPVVHGNLPILGFRFRDTAYVTDVSEIPESSIPLLAGPGHPHPRRPSPQAPPHPPFPRAGSGDGRTAEATARVLHAHRPRTRPRGKPTPPCPRTCNWLMMD